MDPDWSCRIPPQRKLWVGDKIAMWSTESWPSPYSSSTFEVMTSKKSSPQQQLSPFKDLSALPQVKTRVFYKFQKMTEFKIAPFWVAHHLNWVAVNSTTRIIGVQLDLFFDWNWWAFALGYKFRLTFAWSVVVVSVSRSCNFAQKWRFMPHLCPTFFKDCAKHKNCEKWRFLGFFIFYVVKYKYLKNIWKIKNLKK